MKHESTNEPVAWITNNGDGWLRWHRTADNNLNSIPLYTHPQDKRKDEALRLALEALKVAFDQTCSVGRAKDWNQIKEAITLIEQALENK